MIKFKDLSKDEKSEFEALFVRASFQNTGFYSFTTATHAGILKEPFIELLEKVVEIAEKRTIVVNIEPRPIEKFSIELIERRFFLPVLIYDRMDNNFEEIFSLEIEFHPDNNDIRENDYILKELIERVNLMLIEFSEFLVPSMDGKIIKRYNPHHPLKAPSKNDSGSLLIFDYLNITDDYLELSDYFTENYQRKTIPCFINNGDAIRFSPKKLKYLVDGKHQKNSDTALTLLKCIWKIKEDEIKKVNEKYSEYFDGVSDDIKLLLEVCNDENI